MIYHFIRVYPYYTSLCIYTHMYVCVYVCLCVCLCVCVGVHVCVCCACMYIMYAICVCVWVRVCARVCSYMMYMRLSVGHTRTHTHTHTCTTAPQIWVTSFAEKGTSPKQRKMDKQVCPPHYPHPPPLPPRSLPKRYKTTSLVYVLFHYSLEHHAPIHAHHGQGRSEIKWYRMPRVFWSQSRDSLVRRCCLGLKPHHKFW